MKYELAFYQKAQAASGVDREERIKELSEQLDALKTEVDIISHFDSYEFHEVWKLISEDLRKRRVEIFRKVDAANGTGVNHAYLNKMSVEHEYFSQLPHKISGEKRVLLGMKNSMLNSEIQAQEEAINLEYEP